MITCDIGYSDELMKADSLSFVNQSRSHESSFQILSQFASYYICMLLYLLCGVWFSLPPTPYIQCKLAIISFLWLFIDA